MNARQLPNPARSLSAPARLFRLLAAAALTLAFTGCGLATRTHAVKQVVVLDHPLDSTLEQLLAQVSDDYAGIQSITATVDITATTGGQHQGQVKEIPTFAGYIVLRKPADLHILMLLPLVRSRALEMVSDGKNFKLVIPPQNKAVTGTDAIAITPKTGLESLRPYIIRDALLVPPLQSGEEVALIQNSRILPPADGHKYSTEEPDYDLTIVRHAQAVRLDMVRVIHIGRATLRPYQQDIYDAQGRIVTVVTYSKYQKFGDRVFPMSILITRPIDEYTLKIDFSKITFNQKTDDDQFLLKIPESIPIQKMP